MKIRILVFLYVLLVGCVAKKTVLQLEKATLKTEKVVLAISEEELAQGKTIYETNCTKCHQLDDAKEFDKEEWKNITNRMQKKAHLDNIEIGKVYQYIVSNLK